MTEENKKLRDQLKAAENAIISALRSQPDEDDACTKHLQKALVEVATVVSPASVGNTAKACEVLEYPKDANDKYIHIGDTVHMLNTGPDGDHEWDDIVLTFEYVGKGEGDDWLVYGEDGAAWACECEVLKQEGGNDGSK